MPTLSDILRVKGSEILDISPEATVLEATRKMNQFQVGALVVRAQGQVVGIFTERDVLRRVIAMMRSPADVIVGEVMTADVICFPADMDVEDASTIMRDRRVRHLPVCCDESGDLLGMVSIGDINACHASNQQQTIHFLSEYIYGRV